MVRFLVIGAIAAFCSIFAARALDLLGHGQPTVAAAAVATAPAAVESSSDGDAEATIGKGADGHFWADATVDGRSVRFLVDTGATTVALTMSDARNLGLDPDTMSYTYTVMTANGAAPAAPVRLGVVSIGRAEVSNVQAFVLQSGLETSLLGMSYLGRLSKFEATPDSMVLRS